MKFGKAIRLLNVNTLTFKEFSEKEAPAYAVLSHVWYSKERSRGVLSEEIVLHDFYDRGRDPEGPEALLPRPSNPLYLASYEKIIGTCEEAKNPREGCHIPVEYVWIDSICINKQDVDERNRAVPSMWRWYQKAARCIVYLADVESSHKSQLNPKKPFAGVYWFDRGWTLQEFLASKVVHFFNRSWKLLGNKIELATQIQSRTGIEVPYQDPVKFKNATVAKRMSWAAERDTTEGEDRAYSLMGIFEVSFPVNYGEGEENAFDRLQKAILVRSSDESLFAWRDKGLTASGLLAPSLDCFRDSGDIVHYHGKDPRQRPVQVESTGLVFQAPNWIVGEGKSDDMAFYLKRQRIRKEGIELDLYCSEEDPATNKMSAVAIKLEHDRGGWRRIHCGELFHTPKVRYGFFLARAATGNLYGTTGITIRSENIH